MRIVVFICFLLFINAKSIQADDIKNLYLGILDRNETKGKRVTVSGYVDATGCEKEPCKLRLYHRINSVRVLFTLEFHSTAAEKASKKRVLDPIFANCIFVEDFLFKECIF